MLKNTSKLSRQSRPVSHDFDMPSFGIGSFFSSMYNIYYVFVYQGLILTKCFNNLPLRTDSFLQESTFLKIDVSFVSRQSRSFQSATIHSLSHLVSICVFLFGIWHVLFDLEYNLYSYAM